MKSATQVQTSRVHFGHPFNTRKIGVFVMVVSKGKRQHSLSISPAGSKEWDFHEGYLYVRARKLNCSKIMHSRKILFERNPAQKFARTGKNLGFCELYRYPTIALHSLHLGRNLEFHERYTVRTYTTAMAFLLNANIV